MKRGKIMTETTVVRNKMTEAEKSKRLAEKAQKRATERYLEKCEAYCRKLIRKINKHAMRGEIVVGLTLRKKYSNSDVHKYLTDRGYIIKVDYKNGRDFLTIRYENK